MSDNKEVNCVYEEFSSIDKLLKTLDSRPNNKIMEDKHFSEQHDSSFTGTESYQEAVNLLKYGYTDILPQIKREVKKNNKILFKNPLHQRKILNMPIGFVPNVPNALQNKPDSMINIVSTPQKKKTLSIIYAMSGNAGEDTDTFIKAGAALISAINLIELSGIQTRLYVDFMPAMAGGGFFSSSNERELLAPVLRIKNYGERFNLTKICFPLAHPSMFRRIGFKYLETCPFITNSNFAGGYGRVPELNELKDYIPTNYQTYILNTPFIKENNFNIQSILKEVKMI